MLHVKGVRFVAVDALSIDEQGILRGVMPVYPHDEDGEQCL